MSSGGASSSAGARGCSECVGAAKNVFRHCLPPSLSGDRERALRSGPFRGGAGQEETVTQGRRAPIPIGSGMQRWDLDGVMFFRVE